MSQIPSRNGWTIAAQAGDRAPDKTQRLLSRAVWDTVAAMLATDILTEAFTDGVRLDFVCGDEVYGSCTQLREFCEHHGQDDEQAATGPGIIARIGPVRQDRLLPESKCVPDRYRSAARPRQSR